jgi:hypothetical protein
MLFGADGEFASRATLVTGTAGGPSLQATAAEALGLEVGDTVAVGDSTFEIASTWLPVDASDPYWFADPAALGGESAGAFGPLVIDEDALAALDLNPFVRWTLVPDVETITTDQLDPLGDAATLWEPAIREDPELAAGGVIFAGELAATVSTIERGIASVRGVSPIPLVLSGVIGFIALLQLARLLAEVRADETFLLRARGRPASRAALAAAIEGALVVIPGVAIGTALATLLVPGGPGSIVWPAGVAALAVIVLAVVAGVAARRSHRASRATTGAAIAVLVLTIVAAAVSLWQFRLYGSPLITTATGERVVDPIAVLAPALGLAACAVIAVAVLPPLAGGIARVAARGPGLTRVLPARQVARRVSTFAVPLLLVSLSVGGATLAAGYSATWTALTVRAGELRNGSDVRVELATSATVGGATTIVSSPPFTLEGTTAAPTLVAATEAGDDTVSLVALSGAEATTVMAPLGGALDREAVGAAIAKPAQGIALPADATEFAISSVTTVTAVIQGAPIAPGQGDTTLAVWVADAQGALARLPVEAGTVALPVGVAPWTVIAIDANVTLGPNSAVYSVAIDAGATGWVVQEEAGAAATARSGSLGFDLTALEPGPPVLVRLMPEARTVPDVKPKQVELMPVVVTDALAARIGIVAGDTVELRFAGSGLSVTGTVAATTPLLPGSTSSLGVLADLRAVNEQVLRSSSSVPRPDQIWVASPDPATTAAELRPVVPTGARVTTIDAGSGNALQRPVVLALWIGAAGALVLAAAAIAAVAGALGRSRYPEVVALRALGLDNRAQARGRQAELLLVVAIALVLGVVSGLVISALTVGDLARSAVLDAPTGLPAVLQFDVVPLVAMLVGFGAIVIAIVAMHGSLVRRQAATSTGREVGS